MSCIKKACTGEIKYTLSLWLTKLQATMSCAGVESISGPPPEEQRIAYTLNRRLGGPQGRSGSFGEKKNLLSLPRNESQFVGRPVRSLVTAT